eukprot:6577279-Pyramimonas_sp.AAC.1
MVEERWEAYLRCSSGSRVYLLLAVHDGCRDVLRGHAFFTIHKTFLSAGWNEHDYESCQGTRMITSPLEMQQT